MKFTLSLVAALSCLLTLLSVAQSPAGEPATKRLWAKSMIGQKAPELQVEKWLSEKPDTTGKFVMIDFWATWCGPCLKAIPELNGFAEKFKDKLVVIGISDEPEEKVKALKTPKVNYFSAIDTQGRTKKELAVEGIPHVILVDPQGIVRWEGFPFLAGHELTEGVVGSILAGAAKEDLKTGN